MTLLFKQNKQICVPPTIFNEYKREFILMSAKRFQ